MRPPYNTVLLHACVTMPVSQCRCWYRDVACLVGIGIDRDGTVQVVYVLAGSAGWLVAGDLHERVCMTPSTSWFFPFALWLLPPHSGSCQKVYLEFLSVGRCNGRDPDSPGPNRA